MNYSTLVKVVPPNENYPDLVFTANSGIINKNDVFIMFLLALNRFEQEQIEKEEQDK